VDNDCDGEIDEQCDTCTDVDGDGYCDTLDCDDHDAQIYPDGTEVCDDGIDNDCDGQIDEECGPCVDADGDGFCAPGDCDDNDPNVGPAAQEVCGDGVDNDCNGQTDETCEDTGSGSGDGGCNMSRNGPRVSWLFAVLALLGLCISALRKSSLLASRKS
jgi:hypothetical protein